MGLFAVCCIVCGVGCMMRHFFGCFYYLICETLNDGFGYSYFVISFCYLIVVVLRGFTLCGCPSWVSSLWVLCIVCFIVACAFGVGFMIDYLWICCMLMWIGDNALADVWI